MKFLKKTIVFLLVVCFFLETQPAQAQNATDMTPSQYVKADKQYNNGDVNQTVFNKLDLSNKAYVIVDYILDLHGQFELASNSTPSNRTSILGALNENIAMMYRNQPIETDLYLADLGAKAGIVRPAYAQGIGFSGLSPILGLWKAFRNIAYVFLIIIMVMIGFMILFRTKIDPRTVISIQNALPRIVVTLILITFSYAIAGILIDLMYLCIYVSLIAFASAGGGATSQELANAMKLTTGGPLSNLGGAAFSNGPEAVTGLVNLLGGGTAQGISTAIHTFGGLLIGASLGGIPGLVIGGLIGGLAGLGNALLWLIVALALLIAFLRIAMSLLMAYIQIILSVIFGPLQLMFGAIPNVNAFSSWIRGLMANLGVFVVTSVMLLIASMLSAQMTVSNSATNLWVPPGLGGSQGAAVTGLISLGITLLIPSIANSLKDLIKTKSILPVGGALGSLISTPVSGGMQLISTAYYLKNLNLKGIAGALRRGKAPNPEPPAAG